MGSESKLESGSPDVLAENKTEYGSNRVVYGWMLTFDDDAIVCLLSFVSGNEIDNYHKLFTTMLNKFRFPFSVSVDEIDDYHNLFTTALNKSGFLFSISGNEIDDYYSLFTTALNKSEFPSSVSGNEIDDYYNLFTTVVNKSGFTYDSSTAISNDFQFSDLFFL